MLGLFNLFTFLSVGNLLHLGYVCDKTLRMVQLLATSRYKYEN